MRNKILLIDDDAVIRRTISDILSEAGYDVEAAKDAQSGLKLLKEDGISLVLLDLRLPDRDGLEVLEEVSALPERPQVVIITAHAELPKAVQAVKQGAFDFLAKPLDMNVLLITVRNALEQDRMKREIRRLSEEAGSRHRLVGVSPAIREIYALVDKVAPTDASVLISGPSGAGKELVSHIIHIRSRRRDKPLVKINCAAVPETLLESELFGYEKGAFTGAASSKKGKLEAADGGTVFLDEIGDMSPATQSKLLRFLQEGELEKVGSAAHARVDVRVIAATNKDLSREIKEKRFREDLFYRLNEIPIRVPPLSERREDIALLAGYFLPLFCRENGLPEKTISDAAILRLVKHNWRGNVRELKNTVKRLVLLLDRQNIEPQDIDQVLGMEFEPGEATLNEDIADLRKAREDFERKHIRKVLDSCKGNMTKAAEEMGIERSNLYKKVRQLGMENLVV